MVTLVYLCNICGYFCPIAVKSNNHSRDCMACKAENSLLSGPFKRCMPTLGLDSKTGPQHRKGLSIDKVDLNKNFKRPCPPTPPPFCVFLQETLEFDLQPEDPLNSNGIEYTNCLGNAVEHKVTSVSSNKNTKCFTRCHAVSDMVLSYDIKVFDVHLSNVEDMCYMF